MTFGAPARVSAIFENESASISTNSTFAGGFTDPTTGFPSHTGDITTDFATEFSVKPKFLR